MKVILLLTLCLVGSICAQNTAKLVTWSILDNSNSSQCREIAYNDCIECSGNYYQPSECYGFESCYYNIYSDSNCDILQYSQYSPQESCEDITPYWWGTCQIFWNPPDVTVCTDGCTAPVFTVQSDVGVNAFHAAYADGPTLINQSSETEVTVAGRLAGIYYKDGNGDRVGFEGFLDENTYLTTAGYCSVGDWCNSTTSMQYKLDLESISPDFNANYIGFHTYISNSFSSTDYSETQVNVAIPVGEHISYLEVDSDWDLTNFEMKLDFVAASFSGLLPIIIHQNSLSAPHGATYSDMLFVPRGSDSGVLAYNFEIASFQIYQRGECSGSDGIPVCRLDISFDDDFVVTNSRARNSDEMSFTLL